MTLSKAIGAGLPLALLLFRSDLDQWKPGEHTGTFRGNNLAFVASYEALHYWDDMDFSNAIKYKSNIMRKEIEAIAEKYPELNASVRGRGMIFGLEIPDLGFCSQVSERCFENGLIIELAGADDQVVKFLPPLIIDEETLLKGLAIVDQSISELLAERKEKLTAEF
ncbi:MAG: aminotransferase class III-fold pyridoxal phosphate-dependent enzyme [Desulfobacterales bacterium]